MAQYSDGDIVIECSLETKVLLENSKRAKSELVTLGNSGGNAAKGLDKVDKSAKNTGDSLGKLTTIAKAVSAALVSSKIIAYAESWNELEDRIQNTGATAQETKDILDKLLATSNRNGRKINESAELYIKLSNSMKELGFSTDNTLDYIDTLSNLMTINKTSVMGAESAINALTKAQMKGKLSGEEANSVFNAMPSILKTLGTQLKKNEAEVRTMAANGELSMKQFSNAMIAAQDETAKLADNMRNNVGDGINRIENNLKQFLGELNNATGVTGLLVDSLILVSEHVNIVVTAVGVLAAIYAGRYVTSISAATFATLKQSASNLRVASSAGIASMAMKGLNATMNLLGGPAGILLIAAGAFLSWSNSVEQAKQKAFDFGDSLDGLVAKFKGLNKEQRKLELAKLNVGIDNVTEQLEWQAFEVSRLKQEYEQYKKRASSSIASIFTSQEELNKKEKEYRESLEKQRELEDNLKKSKETKLKLLNQESESTDKVTGSTKELDKAWTKADSDKVTERLTKLNQELEISQLKQSKLNKEAYVYQGVLSALGDKSKDYQEALLKAAKNGDLFKGSIKGVPEEIQPLIKKLAELWQVTNNSGSALDSTSQSISNLSIELNIAKYEAQGLIDKANELKAIQALGLDPNKPKEIASNAEQIQQMQKLIEQQSQLNLAKQGLDVAKQEIDSRLSPTEQIAQELKDKQALIDAAHEQGILSEQTYNDAITATKQNAADKQRKIDDDLLQAKLANTQAILSSTGDLFGGLADITKTFGNEQSAAYKAMFAISKGFAIANAALNLQSAISNAMADTPYPSNIAAMANVAAMGGQLASSISSISYGGGREHGGTVAGNSMYRVGEGGKPEILMSGGRQYLIPGENGRVLSNREMKSNGSSGNSTTIIVNQSITFEGGQDSNQSAQQTAMLLKQAIRNVLQEEKRPGGMIYPR